MKYIVRDRNSKKNIIIESSKTLNFFYDTLLGRIILKPFISILFLNVILYFVGCLMLTIVFWEILPEVLSYDRRFYMLIGLFLALFILFL